MKDCIHQFKNKNFIHATILDNCTKTDSKRSLTAFHLTCCWAAPEWCAIARADHHSAETESKSGSSSHIMALTAAVELR